MSNNKCSVFFLIAFFLWIFLIPEAVLSSDNAYHLSFRDRLFAVHFLDEKNGWIVGNQGLILCSKDSGRTWSQVSTLWDHSFNDVTFIGRNGWIVGSEGIILHTGDGGQHWKKQESHSNSLLMATAFLDEKRGVAIGQQTVLWTEDGGSQWQVSPLDWPKIVPETLVERGIISPNLYGLFFLNDTHGWMVGDNGMVFFSSDGGKSWKTLRIGMYPPLYSVFFKDEQEGFAVGQHGTLLRTKDGGKSWHNLNSPARVNLFKIKLAGDYGIVTGDLGTILQSADGGKRWEKIPLDLRPPLPWFLDASLLLNPKMKVICVGEGISREIPIPSIENPAASLRKSLKSKNNSSSFAPIIQPKILKICE
jgi:photosystem II stability/assembly factor-like uncharacterized protein